MDNPTHEQAETQAAVVKYDELVKRLEAATGPSRELDCAIAKAICPYQISHEDGRNGWWVRFPHGPTMHSSTYSPYYTLSIDAALTLVPEGWPIERLSWWPKCPPQHEDQQRCRVTIMALNHDGYGEPRKQFEAVGYTPATAISAVALKARASMNLTTASSGERRTASER